MIQLSPHLTLGQFVATSHREFLHEQSAPPIEVIANARRLAVDLWEPIIERIGSIHLNSGYRSPELNRAVKGAANSAHMAGLAVDIRPLEMSLMNAIAALMSSAIPFDKLIWEFGRWLHVQAARHGNEPRRLVLMTNNSVDYVAFNPDQVHEA
jgi:zinc D-Ala-D-Ala carboxypeptidase